MANKKKIVGVDISKVDEKVLNAALKVAGFDVGGSVEERVNKLADHQRDVTKPDDLADCSTCGGESDVNLPKCPFCGDGEIVEGKAGAAATLKAKAADKAKPVTKPVTKPTKKLVLVTPESVVEVVASALVELDRAVANIDRFKMEAVKNIWALGREIAIIIAGDLWKQRRDDDGTLRHRTFKSFAEHEIGMSAAYAYKLAHISETFTEQEVAAVGTKKLGLMLQLPKPMQDKLIADAMGGASSAEIQERAKPAKPVSDKVSIISVDARVTLPLFARSTKKDKAPRPAMNMTDDPWAEERFENGIVHRYTLRASATGEWMLSIERRRDVE
jgi:hypothetical protein